MEGQREALERYALSLGYGRLARYEDNGASGLTLDRPGFRQMDADIQAGKIDMVLIKDVARIGRDMHKTVRWMNSTIDKGVEIATPTGPCGRFIYPEWEELHRAYISRWRKIRAKKRK